MNVCNIRLCVCLCFNRVILPNCFFASRTLTHVSTRGGCLFFFSYNTCQTVNEFEAKYIRLVLTLGNFVWISVCKTENGIQKVRNTGRTKFVLSALLSSSFSLPILLNYKQSCVITNACRLPFICFHFSFLDFLVVSYSCD